MKQVFIDRQKSVVIKVFQDPKKLERELCGAKAFSRICRVPNIEKLDKKVLKIDLLEGFLGYQIPEDDLNNLVVQMLIKKDLLKFKICGPTIFDEIKNLKKIGDKQTCQRLDLIQKLINNVQLVPIHGDLQKQNIVVSEGTLGLVDFEHFIFAPKELELVNSLYFSDGNCLDIKKISKLLPKGFIDQKILKLMLEVYSIKQTINNSYLINPNLDYRIEGSL